MKVVQYEIKALLLLLLVLVKDKHAQPTTVITLSGYNASLDPEATFTFQCDVTGADTVQRIVDGLPPSRQEIMNRGITESAQVITINEATGSFRQNLSISRNVAKIPQLCVKLLHSA